MPTPVPSAKQCLTTDSASALDEAVSIARRRGHAQTTSLHAVSAFLSLPSSPLRDACLRARNHTAAALYNTTATARHHHHHTPPPPPPPLRTLDFALSLSLDRSPASQHRVAEPPISNSLMAAIKRSQANQRRQPENFTSFGFRPQQRELQQSEVGVSTAGVKVEIQNLILSILDDPIVSRVFNEAGFNSFDIKLAMVRPLQSFWRFTNFNTLPRHSRQFPPPPTASHGGVYLCEMESYNHHPDSHPGFRNFPFSTSALCPDDSDSLPIEEAESSHFRSIREVMGRLQGGRNPLLLGASASDVLRAFLQSLEEDKHRHLLSPEFRGEVGVINIERDISNFANDKNCNEGLVNGRFQELGVMVDRCKEQSGLVLCVGDLSSFVVNGNHDVDLMRCVVVNLTKLWEDYKGRKRLWLIGSSSHEVYLKFSSVFPSVEKDWDMRPLLVNYTKNKQTAAKDDLSFKSSLMGSFVPFAGFFSSPTEIIKGDRLKSSSPFIPAGANNVCREKQLDQGHCKTTSPVNLFQQEADETSPNNWNIRPMKVLLASSNPLLAGAGVQATDDKCMVRTTATTGVHSKLEGCSHPGYAHLSSKPNTHRDEVGPVPSLLAREKKAKTDDEDSHRCSPKNAPHDNSDDQSKSINGNLTEDVQKKKPHGILLPWLDQLVPSESENNSPSKAHQMYGVLESGVNEDHSAQTPHPKSVDTDLMLGLLLPSRSKGEEENPTASPCHKKLPEDFLSFLPEDHNGILNKIPGSFVAFRDTSDPKSLFEALIARVGRQEEALRIISHTITQARSSTNGMVNEGSRIIRGDVWLNFTGQDTVAQKTAALALAEVVCGSKDSFIYVDLCSDNAVIGEHAMRGISGVVGGFSSGSDHLQFQRKFMVDQVAERLRKMPLSVVFVENLNFAHPPMQSSLVHAVKHGKFLDSHGREVSISNAILVLTSPVDKSWSEDASNKYFPEKRVTKARASPIQLTVSSSSKTDPKRWSILNKKKIIWTHEKTTMYADDFDTAPRAASCGSKGLNSFDLDLNFPAEEEIDAAAVDEHSSSWLEDLLSWENSTAVNFQPFNYDALAEKLVVLISRCFSRAFCPDCHLEIECRVMDQMLAAVATAAAACSWERKMDQLEYHWVEEILGRRFVEAQRAYHHRQPAAHCVVKLVIAAAGSASMENQSCDLQLPSDITLKIGP